MDNFIDNVESDEIINYWFDGGPNLWFQSNIEKRNEIDRDINKRFGNILHQVELLNTANIDKLLTVNTSQDNIKKVMSVIIVLDQFSRHIYRETDEDKIKQNTLFALDISRTFLTHFKGFADHELRYLAFFLMPFKHVNLYMYWDFISNQLYKYDYRKCPILYRFYKDSIAKYSLMSNTFSLLPVKDDETLVYDDFINITDFLPPSFWNIKDIFDRTVLAMKNNDLSFKPKKQHSIFNAITGFLDFFLSDQKNITNPIITISISGGVDSMVLTFVLAVLSKLSSQNRLFQLQAVHLNYLNRKVSTDEAKFVVWFCNQLEIPIFLRTINELQRGDQKRKHDALNPDISIPSDKRDFYESLTRKIRFDMYDKLPKSTGQEHSFVVLGHNHDDIIENIWTNFAKGKFIFNLKKMEFTDIQENVLILRPLLLTKKEMIYDFSKLFNIAFLKNTTPEWSNRGKMRNNFLPTVSDTFGDQVNIEYVANTLHEYGEYIEKSLIDPLIKEIEYFDANYQIEGKCQTQYCMIPIHESHLNLGTHFWGTILGYVLKKRKIPDPTRKSIDKFIHDLRKIYQTDKHQTKKINIKKGVWGILHKKNLTLSIHIEDTSISSF